MFEIEILKNNGEIGVEINDSYSVAQLDIALKDICIELKRQSKRQENFKVNENGNLKISVTKRNRELNDEERVYSEMKIIPTNSVLIESQGFGFSEIQQVMQNIKLQLPSNFTSIFMYNVNFVNLSVD